MFYGMLVRSKDRAVDDNRQSRASRIAYARNSAALLDSPRRALYVDKQVVTEVKKKPSGIADEGVAVFDRVTRFIPTDIASIACRHCMSTARLIRREPPPGGVGEMLTFKCEKCDKESKAIVQI